MSRLVRCGITGVVAIAVQAPAFVLSQERVERSPAGEMVVERIEPINDEVAKDGPGAVRIRAKAAMIKPGERAKVAAVDEDKNLAPLIQQFKPRFQSALRAEYHFARTVCGLTKDQRKQIAGEATRALDAVVTSYARDQLQMRQGLWPDRVPPDPQKMVQASLAKLLRAHVTPEQIARYSNELEKRTLDRNRAVAGCLVARLDHDLVLDSAQRETITKSLLARWDGAWAQSLDMLAFNEQVFPVVPDELVAAHLTPEQKKVWFGIPKVQVNSWGNQIFVGGMADASPLDEEVAEREDAAPKAPADGSREP